MSVETITNESEKEKNKLKSELSQYLIALNNKENLEKRLKKIKLDVIYPLQSPVLGIIKSDTHSDMTAMIITKLVTIETRLQEAINNMLDTLEGVLDIIELLDNNTPERIVLELRYIDNYDWFKIQQLTNYSRTQCFNIHTKALEDILKIQKK